jgi:hypothetical protein
MDVQRMWRSSGRIATPHRFDQDVGRDDLAGSDREDGEHGPGVTASQRQRPALDDHIDRPQQPDLGPGGELTRPRVPLSGA